MKNKILIFGVMLITAFAIGRYTAEKTVTTSTNQVKAVDKDEHVRTETTTVKNKDGSVKTITLTDKSTNIKSKTDTKTESKVETGTDIKIRVSLLAAYDFTNKEKLSGISVGASMGPVSIGVFGLSGSNEKIGGIFAGIEF